MQALLATIMPVASQLVAYALAMAQAAVLWFVVWPLRTTQALTLRASRKAWRLFLAPVAVSLSIAMLLGFLLGFVLSQLAVYLEVFPKRRESVPAVAVAPRRPPHRPRTHYGDEWNSLWARQHAQRFEKLPAASSPPPLEPPEAEDDEAEWKNASSVPSSDDDSDYIGFTEGEEAAAAHASTVPTSPLSSPKYAGPVGIGFYAQFRPDTSESSETVLDNVDDDGYASPGRSRSRSDISYSQRRRSVGSPLSSPLQSPPGSPMQPHSMSRVHSLTQISNPIYEVDEV